MSVGQGRAVLESYNFSIELNDGAIIGEDRGQRRQTKMD